MHNETEKKGLAEKMYLLWHSHVVVCEYFEKMCVEYLFIASMIVRKTFDIDRT